MKKIKKIPFIPLAFNPFPMSQESKEIEIIRCLKSLVFWCRDGRNKDAVQKSIQSYGWHITIAAIKLIK